jgi:D-ribose pyranose/furanose isomerase RbsD
VTADRTGIIIAARGRLNGCDTVIILDAGLPRPGHTEALLQSHSSPIFQIC